MNEDQETRSRADDTVVDEESRRFSQRVKVPEPLFEAAFQVRDKEHSVLVIDMSALGFMVDFQVDPPPVGIGAEAFLTMSLLGKEFELQAVVRRIEGSRVAFWFPEIVSGDSPDGVHLQDLILDVASSS